MMTLFDDTLPVVEVENIEIGPSPKKVRRKRAISSVTPSLTLPASAPVSINDVEAIVSELVVYQRRRCFAITQKNRMEQAMESLLRIEMGYRIDAPEKGKQVVIARAKAYRLYVEKHEVQSPYEKLERLAELIPEILISSQSRSLWDMRKKHAETKLIDLAKGLPVYDFVLSVSGFSALGLACWVGEAARPLNQYRTVSALWKRMGVAVMGSKDQYHLEGDKWVRHGQPGLNDKRQRKCTDKVEADIHQYSPRRRAEVWAFTDSMFRHQWCGQENAYRKEIAKHPEAREEFAAYCAAVKKKPSDVELEDLVRIVEPYRITAVAHAAGPYGQEYADRRARTAPRVISTSNLHPKDPDKWTDGRCNNDGKRIMSKALLRDLWRVWNGMPPRHLADTQ